MAKHKSYHNLHGVPWTFMVFVLLLSSASAFTMDGERIRHNHHDVVEYEEEEDVYRSQLERTAIEAASETTPLVGCPNCLYKTESEFKAVSDNLRLEAIKRQILTKLGLRHKPNVTFTLPRDVIMATISRAEDGDAFMASRDPYEEDYSTTSARSNHPDPVDVDDFYGRTSEIITFGEGKVQDTTNLTVIHNLSHVLSRSKLVSRR